MSWAFLVLLPVRKPSSLVTCAGVPVFGSTSTTPWGPSELRNFCEAAVSLLSTLAARA